MILCCRASMCTHHHHHHHRRRSLSQFMEMCQCWLVCQWDEGEWCALVCLLLRTCHEPTHGGGEAATSSITVLSSTEAGQRRQRRRQPCYIWCILECVQVGINWCKWEMLAWRWAPRRHSVTRLSYPHQFEVLVMSTGRKASGNLTAECRDSTSDEKIFTFSRTSFRSLMERNKPCVCEKCRMKTKS